LPATKIVGIDGWHRWQAYEAASKQTDLFEDTEQFEQIEYHYWQDKVIDSQNTVDMLLAKLHAAEVNSRHGDRLIETDKKALAREIVEKCPKEEIGQSLGQSQQRISEWTADIRARQTANRDCLIKKLSLLGWTQEEIGQKVGIAQRTVSHILSQNTDFGKIAKEVQVFLEQGKTMDWIAEVEKVRGVIRNYYDRLKQVDGFEVFEEGRTPEEAVVSMIKHFVDIDYIISC